VPEVLNVPIFNNYDNHKNLLTDFLERECKFFKQVFLVVPIFHVCAVCHCKRLPMHLLNHLFHPAVMRLLYASSGNYKMQKKNVIFYLHMINKLLWYSVFKVLNTMHVCYG